jgi:hypothetical protein
MLLPGLLDAGDACVIVQCCQVLKCSHKFKCLVWRKRTQNTHTHTQTHMRTHIHTHAHTHIHTHTRNTPQAAHLPEDGDGRQHTLAVGASAAAVQQLSHGRALEHSPVHSDLTGWGGGLMSRLDPRGRQTQQGGHSQIILLNAV